MKLTNQQVISFLNKLIEKINNNFTKQVANKRNSIQVIEELSETSNNKIAEIQNVINYISLFN